MPPRPVIGVTTQTLHSIDGIPAELPQSVVMNQRYYFSVAVSGAAPVLIPLLDDQPEALRGAYEACDGILIPGGVDIDPTCFGESAHPKLGRIDPARDRTEIQLAKWAMEEGKPLLGLCRGLQVINVALGGTLWQDLEQQVPESIKHDYFPNFGFERTHLAHEVALTAGSRLRQLMELDSIEVNSMHHQGIRTLAPSLLASAIAPDGLIEAAETTGEGFCIGVQWHPEVFELSDPHTRHVFREFVVAAGAYRDASH
ncbi:MAG: gamma-glutamyl-gamma-aminobutyrate hydrolase family protein [Gemmatimonadaceae bacterium]